MLKKLFFASFLSLIFAAATMAQEVEVDKYTITARIDAAASAVDVTAGLAVTNLGQAPKSKLYFRLNKLAKVSSVNVNGASAVFEATDDRRVNTLSQITLTPSVSVAAGAKATIDFSYRIEAPESSGLTAIYPGEVVLLPEAVWVPMPSTMFTQFGATTAPFSLTVSGSGSLRGASAGAIKGAPGGPAITFDQTQNSIPFLIASTFGDPISFEQGGIKVDILVQQGLGSGSSDAKASDGAVAGVTTARFREETGRIIDFLTKTLGAPPAGATFRIISSARAGNIAVPGAVVFNEQTFRRGALSIAAVELLADSLARVWTDGRVRIRGQEGRSAQADRPAQKARSTALLRDSLPRYLAMLYFDERFGKEAGREAISRLRWIYTPVAAARRDAELGIQTIALPTYTAAAFAKGPLVLRLLAETAGRDKLIAVLRQLFSGAQTKVVTVDDFRSDLVKAGGPEIEKLFQQWLDSIIEPDIVIGIPQPGSTAGVQRVNLRNLGTGDVTVSVVGATASGKQVQSSVNVPSENLTSVEFQTAEKITALEVDPEKFIIQSSYDNDTQLPVRPFAQTLFNDGIVAFNKGEFPLAETKLREAARIAPNNALVHAWLARSLSAQNKSDEAIAAANAAIKIEPPVGSALGWSYLVLGQIANARGQHAEAIPHLRRALLEAEEAPAQFAARDLLAKAEQAGRVTPQVDESIRTFITQLDALIKQPSSDKLFAVVNRNNLKRFVQGLTVTPASDWKTEVLRVDQRDANRIALDVALKVKAGGKDQEGTASFLLYRGSAGWVLEDVLHFNVK